MRPYTTVDFLDACWAPELIPVTSNTAIVRASKEGKIDAFASDLTQLILDISSYFAP